MINIHNRTKIDELPKLLRQFLKDEAIGGRLILLTALAALIATNTIWRVGYFNLWDTQLRIGLSNFSISQNLLHWVNEGLMTFFFLVVGLEIKREIIDGELRSLQTAVLPVVAAIGGMVLPALIFMVINTDQKGSNGWGIPMATDIAIVMGLLTLLGRRITSKLKIFLLTLAIIDDVGAILVIAIFYNKQISVVALLVAILLVAALFLLNRSKAMTLTLFSILGICVWIAIYKSGINASITGVILGLLAPLFSTRSHKYPISTRLEKTLLPATTFFIVPLFVFANAGVTFKTTVFHELGTIPVAVGVILGLVVGKVVGITLATWIVVKLRIGRLPSGTTWSQFIGMGFLAGVGFTISIFITGLAFNSKSNFIDASKIGIFIGSVISAVLGLYTLRKSVPDKARAR